METAKTKSGGSGLLWVLILILVLVLGGAAYFGYKIIFPDDSTISEGDEDTDTDEGADDITGEEVDEEEVADEDAGSAEEEDVDDSCVQNPAPAGWTAVDNTYAGYTAYRPGWYYRIFSPGAMLGMGPSSIPVDSEYAGDIVIIKHTIAQAAAETEFTDRLEAGYTETTVTAGCREWKVYEGTEPANELFDAKDAKAAFVTVDGDVYSVEMAVVPASYASTEAKFDILIDIMIFN